MRISIFVPSIGKVAGGALVLYQYANHLVRRGHEVHVGHVFFTHEPKIPLIDNASWFSFADGLHHHCRVLAGAPTGEIDFEVWDSDVMLGQPGLVSGYGLPVAIVQGSNFGLDELSATRMEGPIICVSKSVIEDCIDQGIDAARLIYAPNGVDHEVFHPPSGLDLARRPPRVSTICNWVASKRSRLAVEVLERVRAEVPDLEAVVFGADSRPSWIPEWITYRADPDHQTLAREVYGTSRAYLCASDLEGFGLTSLEAMACGAALVTTDTRGSRDFAEPERTALVCEPGDADALVENLLRILRDDGLRIRLAEAGIARAATFNWDRTAQILEDLFEQYLADPDVYVGGRSADGGAM